MPFQDVSVYVKVVRQSNSVLGGSYMAGIYKEELAEHCLGQDWDCDCQSCCVPILVPSEK